MGLTASLVEVNQALLDKLLTNKVALGLADAFYGDQDLINSTPVACVESGHKINNLDEMAVNRKLNIIFDTYIIIYASKVSSSEVNKKDSELFAEAIESFIHLDRTLGGLLIHCYITELVPGYSNKNGSLYRSSKLTFHGISQAILPS